MFPDTLPADVAACLDRHILRCWFPRAVDPKGGFFQSYDDTWKPGADHERNVVYQARLTWTAAEAALRGKPEEASAWREQVAHGVAYLDNSLWDDTRGGFYWSVDTETKQSTRDEKHVYGNAFAIYALARAYKATKNSATLEQAKRGFAWLERHAHDSKHLGWHEALTLDGTPKARGAGNDQIGTALGLKSMNTHIHVLEALTALYGVWPDALVRTRLAEAHALVRDTIAQPDGYQRLFFQPDWTPVPDHLSFGHDVETGFLLHESAHALGLHNEKTEKIARALVDHALQYGWDEKNGGFFDVADRATKKIEHQEKVWWVEAEGLNALLLMHRLYGRETSRYGEAFQKLWAFIRDKQCDSLHSGWFSATDEVGVPQRSRAKSDAWTDPYHQARSLWHVLDGLRASARSR